MRYVVYKMGSYMNGGFPVFMGVYKKQPKNLPPNYFVEKVEYFK